MEKNNIEIGQALFGQPTQQFNASEKLISALRMVEDRLYLQYGNKYESPFQNTGNHFTCDTFEIFAYSWDEDVLQNYNFKYKDIYISWYKYLGRGTTVNKLLSDEEIIEMVDSCLAVLKTNLFNIVS